MCRLDAELVLAAGDPERPLVLVLLPDPELHAGNREVQLGEEARAARVVDELVDLRQRLHRPLGDGVEPAMILAKKAHPVRLQAQTRPRWRARRTHAAASGAQHRVTARTRRCLVCTLRVDAAGILRT